MGVLCSLLQPSSGNCSSSYGILWYYLLNALVVTPIAIVPVAIWFDIQNDIIWFVIVQVAKLCISFTMLLVKSVGSFSLNANACCLVLIFMVPDFLWYYSRYIWYPDLYNTIVYCRTK